MPNDTATPTTPRDQPPTRRELEDRVDEIEARPLSRAARDRLQAPLLAVLRLGREVERIRRFGFTGQVRS